MRKLLIFLIQSISYGLAIAFVILLFSPQMRSGINLTAPLFTNDKPKNQVISYAEAVRKAAPAVVNISSQSFVKNPQYLGNPQVSSTELGSGVLMNNEGYILTAYHVIDKADQISVLLQDGRMLEAELIGTDKITDLAVLKIKATNLPTIPQQDVREIQVGDVVLAIGNPLNIGQTITQGIISATGKKGIAQSSHTDLIQMDAAINVGSSGGALVDSNGHLVGINAANFRTRQNMGIQGIFFAVPYKIAINVMNKIIQHGQVIRGWLGISGGAINSAGAPVLSNVESVVGIQITNMDRRGPAFKAGIQLNDILLAVEGQKIASLQEVLDLVANTMPDTTLNFTISRAGKVIQLPVVIKALPNT